MRSKKLLRQIRKILQTEDFETEILQLATQLKEGQPISNPQQWAERLFEFGNFLDSIENSYVQNETQLELLNRSLEVSTKELYEANEKFRFINKAMNAMVNSLDEGFFVIDREGKCGQISSLSAIKFLGREPKGEHLSDILNIPDSDQEAFTDWLEMVFNEVIAFEDLIDLAPKQLNQPESSLKIEVKFKPIRNPEDQRIVEIVVILIDNTERAEAEKKLSEQKIFTEMVIKYFNNKSSFVRMIQMTRETSESMKYWTFNSQNWHEQINSLNRILHTLKGGFNTLSMHPLGSKVHQIEDTLLILCKSKTNLNDIASSIRQLSHELETELQQFLQKHRRILNLNYHAKSTTEIPTNNIYNFSSELLRRGLTDLLQHFTDAIVAVPLESLFAPIEAHVYSQSLNQDKNIDFKIIDPQRIRVIPEFYTELFEQMVHIFNNILDHGIETTEERNALNKDVNGSVTISLKVVEDIQHLEQGLLITISDDGRGINPSLVRDRLAEKGILTATESDEQVIYHIFDQGFSTQTSTTLTSGRGVGMAAVLKTIQSMQGTIAVKSAVGQGTQFDIVVPYVRELDAHLVEWYNTGNSSSGPNSAVS